MSPTFARHQERSPLPAQTDDGNHWVSGQCMLYCRRNGTRVLWLGPIHAPGATGAMYGCGQCIAELVHMVHDQLCQKDLGTLPSSDGRTLRS